MRKRAKLSESERHAIAHARWQVDHTTDDNPEICFDRELVSTWLELTDRLLLSAGILLSENPPST